MTNPLDDAFAKADRERAAAAHLSRERQHCAELAAQAWLEAYQGVLRVLSQRVSGPGEELTLAWPAATEPPGSVLIEGRGLDQGSMLGFGTCEAWCFPHLEPYEKGNRRSVYVSTDCTTVFTAESSAYPRTKGILRSRSVPARMLGPFVDVRTGRYTLEVEATPDHGTEKYRVSAANLPSPVQLAEIIAGVKPSGSPSIRWVK